MKNVVEIKNLSFIYKNQVDVKALDVISLEIQEGEFLFILGSSGSGKSTLAHCLNGIIPNMLQGNYSGEVKINGKKVDKYAISKMAKDIGIVFQDFENQYFSTNVRDEIAFSLENFSFPREEMDEIIDKMLNLVGLKDYDNYVPATLSGGQKQRLTIGAVLASHPNILCMDEPTANLDPIGKSEVLQIAKNISEKLTLIIIQNEIDDALTANRIMTIKDGKIFRLGTAKKILSDISAFEECGIMPLQVPKFFSIYKGDKPKQLPLSPKEGIKVFEQFKIAINEKQYKNILIKEKNRDKKYGEILIDVKNLNHTYTEGTIALHDINLQIRQGEFIAIIGQNGSGKTTLVKHFNGLLKPTEGTINICGNDVTNHNIFELGQDVGLVFQNPDHQIFSDTVYDEVAFSPKMRGVTADELKNRVSEALHSVGLDGFDKEDPFSMSKGIRQRIAVASVLSAKPKVIIFDEPTTGLDYVGQKKMMEFIKKLNEEGHTVIIITHTMWVVAEYAHRVVVMNKGEIAMSGTTREIFSKGEELKKYSLKTPHITELSNNFGKTVLSVNEMIYCTENSGE